jgi:hypothetical protein
MEAMECPVTLMAGVSAKRTLTARSVENAKRVITITLPVKNVTVTQQESWLLSKDVVLSLQENFVSVKIESLAESAINARTCYGT